MQNPPFIWRSESEICGRALEMDFGSSQFMEHGTPLTGFR
jgi:hypothetical protein